MTVRFALMISPATSDAASADFTDTFTSVDPTSPALSVGELSTQRGDGVFETIGVIDGHAQEVTAHLERLAQSARLCDLPEPHREQWRQAIALAEAQCPPGEAVIKLILSRGIEHGPAPTAWVTASAAPDFSAVRRDGVRVVTLDRGYASGTGSRAPWLLLGAKTLSYAVNMAALREAQRRGADDAIFVTTDGFVMEAPTAAVVVRIDGRFVTPPATGDALQSTTQLSVYEFLAARGADVDDTQIPVADLRKADAAWLLSSVRLAVPVTAIDGAPVPVDAALTGELNDYLLSPRD